MRLILGILAGAACAAGPAVAFAFSSTPNDGYYHYQWALTGNASSTNAPRAWCVATGAGIVVADIDTGADLNHPDLAGKLIVGARFTSGNAYPGPNPQPDSTSAAGVMDDYGHGTMTTGLMVAATGNGAGIAAESPGARAQVIKVFSQKGGANGYSAYNSDVAAAVYWAVEHGARVINLSLGPEVPSILPGVTGDSLPAAIQWAAQHGAGVAISAGNGFGDLGVTPPGQPASYPQLYQYALVVGAMGPDGTRASYSQSGSGVNIFAPGGDGADGDPNAAILSTFPTEALSSSNQPMRANVGARGYAAYNGTSFSAPYAAGTLALLMSHGYSAAQARQRIIDTAKRVGGFAVLDAAAALGGCPSGGGAGGSCCGGGGGTTTGGGSGGASAGAHSTPKPGARHTPTPSAGAGSSAPGQTPAGKSPSRAASGPPAVAIGLGLLAALAVLGIGGWLVRTRLG